MNQQLLTNHTFYFQHQMISHPKSHHGPMDWNEINIILTSILFVQVFVHSGQCDPRSHQLCGVPNWWTTFRATVDLAFHRIKNSTSCTLTTHQFNQTTRRALIDDSDRWFSIQSDIISSDIISDIISSDSISSDIISSKRDMESHTTPGRRT